MPKPETMLEPTLPAILNRIDRRLERIEATVESIARHVQVLNDWHTEHITSHARFSGALLVLGLLGTGAFAVALVVLKHVLERL